MKKLLLILFFAPSVALADGYDTTLQNLQGVLNAIGQIKIEAKQAVLVGEVQKAILRIGEDVNKLKAQADELKKRPESCEEKEAVDG